MKILEETDDYLIIQCERFDAGKEPVNLPKSNTGELLYITLFVMLICLSGISFIDNIENIVLNFKMYWSNHQLQSVFYGLVSIIFANNTIHSIFFKKDIIRADCTYKIERDSKFSLDRPYKYDLYTRIMAMVEDEPPPKIIDRVDFVDEIEIDEMYDSEIEGTIARAYRKYKVMFAFKSGQAWPIESNYLPVTSAEENQAALRQLISDTKPVVERIKKFLSISEANE